jgi:hypothetical protein
VFSNLVAIRHSWQKDIEVWPKASVQKWISNGKKYSANLFNSDKSVAKIVVNVAT